MYAFLSIHHIELHHVVWANCVCKKCRVCIRFSKVNTWMDCLVEMRGRSCSSKCIYVRWYQSVCAKSLLFIQYSMLAVVSNCPEWFHKLLIRYYNLYICICAQIRLDKWIRPISPTTLTFSIIFRKYSTTLYRNISISSFSVLKCHLIWFILTGTRQSGKH